MTTYVSDVLTATKATVVGDPAPTTSWVWRRNDVEIAGTNSSTYTVTTADIGSRMSVTEIESNMIGAASSTSAQTGVVAAFDALTLFQNNEIGAVFDASDMTTMYQDSAGTTRVTAVEQPVGLWLDKSKGLVQGSQLWSNASVTVSGGSSIVSPGVYRIYSADGTYSVASVSGTLVVGKPYIMTFTIDSITTVGGGVTVEGSTTAFFNTTGAKSVIFFATGTAVGIKRQSGAVDYQVSNVSVRELPGYHAYQTTSASRPVLSARYNLLTNTAFTGAVAGTPGTAPTDWPFNSSGGSITSLSGGVIAFSASNARQIIGQTFSFAANQSVKARVVVASNPSNLVFNQLFALVNATGATSTYKVNGVVVDNVAYVPKAGDVLSIELVNGATPTTPTFRIGVGASAAATGSASFSGPDLRVLNDGVGIPDYQLVTTSTNYDTTGFPMYIKSDGVDDFMVTSSIPFTTDKMTVVAGVRKLSDAAVGTILELSASTGSNDGTFSLVGPGALLTSYMFRSRGTIFADAEAAAAAPNTSVLTGVASIGTDVDILRRNGTQVASTTTDQGTGNFGSYPLYLFSRAGTSTWFGGRTHAIVIRGAACTTAQLQSAEDWVNSKTYAYEGNSGALSLDLNFATQSYYSRTI